MLRGNDAGRFTIPGSGIYPHQWNWDSALASLGWAEIDPARAWTELESLVGGRDERGMVPHIAFRSYERGPGRQGPLLGRLAILHRTAYLPGAAWWGERRGFDGRRISGITQPPVAATCVRLLFERAPDEARARALLSPLHDWHGFLLSERDPQGLGEPVLIHPWESGRDNAPEWDRPLFRVRARPMLVRRRDTAHVDVAERPSTAHYRRYLTLVAEGTAAGWDQHGLAASGPFRVIDTAFSAILARACEDLAVLAAQLGEHALAAESEERAARVTAAIGARALADGRIPSVDLRAGEPLDLPSAGPALAVFAPRLSSAAVNAACGRIAGELDSPWGVRSYAKGAAGWSPRNYWRGPVWANITWLCALGLESRDRPEPAAELRRRMLRMAAEAGMREYVSADTGRGLGASRFTWTAALALRELSSPRAGSTALLTG